MLDGDIRRLVIGRTLPDAQLRPATLAGFARRHAYDGPYPILLNMAGRHVDGVLATGLTARETARLDAYEGTGYRRVRLPVSLAAGGSAHAEVYLPLSRLRPAPGRWDLQTWRRYEKQAYLRALDPTIRFRRAT